MTSLSEGERVKDFVTIVLKPRTKKWGDKESGVQHCPKLYDVIYDDR